MDDREKAPEIAARINPANPLNRIGSSGFWVESSSVIENPLKTTHFTSSRMNAPSGEVMGTFASRMSWVAVVEMD
jgi:hypothetical protein